MTWDFRGHKKTPDFLGGFGVASENSTVVEFSYWAKKNPRRIVEAKNFLCELLNVMQTD